MFNYKKSILILITGLVFVLPFQSHALEEKTYKSLDIFTKVMYLVQKDYVEKVNGEDLIYGAIKGMLGTLDPYSVFLTPDVYKELKVDTVGRFGGVGLEITLKKGVLTVVTPLEDTPAAQAGIRPGDRILKINGKSTKGMNLVDAVRRMRGHKKSKVSLTLWRSGVEEPIEVTLTRETIKVKSVKYELLSSGVGYIRLTNFQEKSSEELIKAIRAMEKEAGGNLKGLILDVRNNPGGLLDEALVISDLFLKSGTIVSTRGREGIEEVHKATQDDEYIAEPVVVLINRGSASASEIVAAALQDNKRAKVLGTKSFGKASVQTVIDLGEETGLKLTIAKYFTPEGVSISGKGIKPDFEVTFPEELGTPFVEGVKEDPQKEAAEVFLLTGKVPPQKPQAAGPDDEEEGPTHSDLQEDL